MRTIAINPTRRKKVAKRKSKRSPARRRAAPKLKNPTRRKRRANPKAGISPQELRNLGMAAAGGAAAGALTNYLDQAKPAFLKSVPTEGVAIIAGALLTAFGKTPIMKNLAIGMVSYGAGELASRMTGPGTFTAPMTPVTPPGDPGVQGFITTGIQSNPGHYNMDTSAHVGNLLVTVR